MKTASSLLHGRKALLLTALLIVFPAFTADVVDLREELSILSGPYNILESDVTTGIASESASDTVPLIVLRAVHPKSSVKISFLHLLPYTFRAPPFPARS